MTVDSLLCYLTVIVWHYHDILIFKSNVRFWEFDFWYYYDILIFDVIFDVRFDVIFQKRVRVVQRGFQTRENWWKHEAIGRVLLLFSSVWKPRWNTKHEFLKLLLNRASLIKNNEKILTDFGIVLGI